MSNTFSTHLTTQGYRTLMTKGLTNEIKLYQLLDNSHNYEVTATENLVLPATGNRGELTTSKTSFADYQGILVNKPSTEEIKTLTGKVQLNFINRECDYTFDQPNISLNINLHSWIYELQNLTYSFDMPGLSKDLWDFMQATIQTLNVTTKTYENVMYNSNLGVTWVPKTDVDINNIKLLSPTYIHSEGSSRKLIDGRDSIRNASPMFLSLSTYNVNGQAINNTAGKIHLVTNEFGYWVNNNTFVNTSALEQTDLNLYKTVYPAAKVGRNIYYLPTQLAYPTNAGFVGYAMRMVNVDGSNQTLISGLIDQIILFTKTYFKPDDAGVYTMVINLSAIVTGNEVNSFTQKTGGEASLIFRYDPNNVNSNESIIQLN
jgi:hypothetical protein